MHTRLNPYISFQGTAREAMEFYKSIFNGTLEMNLYKDGGMPHEPSEGDKIIHAQLEGDNGIVFMASDIPNSMGTPVAGNISMSLSGDNKDELTRYYQMLAQDGTILEPLATAPWGDTFGMLTDKFGVTWLVNIAAVRA